MSGLRLILVEDSADDEALVRAELRRSGLEFTLVRVETADELRSRLAEPWDLVLADYQLPSFSAPEALAIVKESGLDLPFIVVSGSIGEDVAVLAMKAGAADYFRKENITRLVPAIEREMAEKRNREQKRKLERELEATLENERRLRVVAEDARAEAEQANRLKDEFLAMVSHELRTPLNAVLGWAHLLRRGKLAPEARDRALEKIERNAQAQAQIIDDLLDLSRITSGKLALEARQVDVAAVVDAAVDTIKPKADAKKIAIVREVCPELVHGDPARLQQVLWNLLSNAVRFSDEGSGPIRVSARREGSKVVIQVADAGGGISPGFLPHVFEPFRQADQSTTRRVGGLGLGLAISKRIADLHGGALTVRSEGPGRGATFTLALPVPAVTPADVPQPSAVEPRPKKLTGVRVLVVDDEEDARELVGELLSAEGAEARIAAGAQAALGLLETWLPSVLVSDIGMPGMDGYELVRRIRALPPEQGGEVPAAALTAYAAPTDVARALQAGFQSHLAKPVDPDRLVEVVAALAERRSGVQPTRRQR